MRWPSIADVADELRTVNNERLEPDDSDLGIDVRLQVYEDGRWAVRFGDPSYDTDHHGYWGSASVPGDGRRFNARETARDLIEQAKDQFYSR